MSIGSNIRRIRERYGLTQEEFGKIADVSSMAVSQWENDRAVPRMGAVQALADYFNISKGEIVDDVPQNQISYPDGAKFPNDSQPAYAPLLGRVHAGDAREPDIVDDRIPIPFEVRERHKRGYFLQVEGQCMSRVYPEGCFIYIDPDQQPHNGSIAVVSINGSDYVMRRLYSTGQTVVLSPDSWEDGFEDIVLTAGDERTVEYVGTVVWFQPSREME